MMRECDPRDLILLQLLVSPFITKSGILMLQLEVSEIELTRRRTDWQAPSSTALPGYQTLHVQHTLQADRGCDLDFLVGRRQAGIPRESH